MAKTETEIKINQYLSFVLDNELYAFNVLKVHEVLEVPKITKVPKMPNYMCGVINLRGAVVPVIDLRLKFNLAKKENTIETNIIVIELSFNNESVVIGAVADSVKEVIELPENQIEPAPKIGTKIHADFIDGIGKHHDEFIMILNIQKVFSEEEVYDVKGASSLATDTEE